MHVYIFKPIKLRNLIVTEHIWETTNALSTGCLIFCTELNKIYEL